MRDTTIVCHAHISTQDQGYCIMTFIIQRPQYIPITFTIVTEFHFTICCNSFHHYQILWVEGANERFVCQSFQLEEKLSSTIHPVNMPHIPDTFPDELGGHSVNQMPDVALIYLGDTLQQWSGVSSELSLCQPCECGQIFAFKWHCSWILSALKSDTKDE